MKKKTPKKDRQKKRSAEIARRNAEREELWRKFGPPKGCGLILPTKEATE